ncbi:MAG: PaaI family thioesterase [Deltaproteobacteria bacterium]|nr:PaaI family thioesterase [Deltaproteobacteria bacterium]
MNPEWRDLPNPDRFCFACGADNHCGLRMTFAENGQKLRSRVALSEHTRGWHNLVHGGILATVLDETLSWTAIQLKRSFVLTRRMEIEYRKPVAVGSVLRGYGWIIADNGRRLTVNGEIFNLKEELCCRGQAEFSLFSGSEFARLKIVPEEFIRQVEAGFQSPQATISP